MYTLSYRNDRAGLDTSVEIGLALRAKTDDSRDAREERVVDAGTDVGAGKYRSAALAYDYLTDLYFLTVGAFDAEIFRI